MVILDPDNLPPFVFLLKNHNYKLKMGFYTAPSNPKIFSKAVKLKLDKLKYTFCPDLNGFIMGYGKIISNEIIQTDIRQCISVTVNVDVFIFSPPVGSILEAVVNQTSDNYVSCLVYNLFNILIVQPEHQPFNQWPGSKIKKDDIINVKVLSFDLTEKLAHITGDIADKNDGCNKPKNEQENYSIGCSSIEKSVSNFNKPSILIKQESAGLSKLSSSDSEPSVEMSTTTSPKKYDDKSNIISPLFSQTTNNNRKNIKSQLFSSTPIANTDHTISSINIIRNKQLEQLQKHDAGKIINKQLNKFEKDISFHSSNIVAIRNSINNECNLPSSLASSDDNSDCASKVNQIESLQSVSGISDDKNKNLQLLVQKFFSKPINIKTNQTSPKSNEKIINPDKIKSEHIDYTINKRRTNTVKTTVNYNTITSDEGIFNKSVKNITKPSIVNSLVLSTKKRNTIQANNDKKDCKNQIDNTIVTKQSIISPTASDSESSNEIINLLVKGMNDTKNVYNEIENNKFDNLTGSKLDITNIQFTSSSDDDIYTNLKLDKSKPFTKNCNFYDIFPNDTNESLPNFIYDTSTSSSKLIKLNKNQKTLKKNKKKKRESKKSTIPKSPNSTKVNNNKDKLIKQILGEESSSNDDNLKCTPLISSINDIYKQKNQKVLKKTPISNGLKSKKTNKELISDPFIKLHVENPAHSSSENGNVINYLINSEKLNYSFKKNNTMVENEKNNLIKQVLTSMKYTDEQRKQSLSVKGVISNPSVNSNKLRKVKDVLKIDKSNKDKMIIKNKILKKFRNPIDKSKSNTLIHNISEQRDLSRFKIQSSTDDSTDDDIEFLKTLIEDRKLDKNKNVNVPVLTIKNNSSTKLNKHNKTTKKIDEITKFQNTSIIDLLASKKIKTKQKSSSYHTPIKKKQTVHSLMTKSNNDVSKQTHLDKSLFEIKKKKKNKHNDDIINLILKDNKLKL